MHKPGLTGCVHGTKSGAYMAAGQIWVKRARKRAVVRQRIVNCWDKWAGEDVVSPSLEGFKDGNDLGVTRGQVSLLRSLLAISFMLLRLLITKKLEGALKNNPQAMPWEAFFSSLI